MFRRRVVLAAIGIALGAGAALGALLLFEGAEPAATTTAEATTTTTTPAAWWVNEDEIPLGPAVLVIEGLAVEGDEAVLGFGLYDINPVVPGRRRDPDWLTTVPLQRLAEEAAVAPSDWTLLTAAGEIPGTTSGPRSRTARFPLPGGVLPEVLGLRLDRYWMRLPYAYEVALPLDAAVTLDRGYTAAVSRLIEQTDSTIVQVDLATGGGLAVGTDPGALLLAAVGEGWTFTSGRTSSGLQLVYEGGPVPDPIRFAARSAYWVPFDRPVDIEVGALRLG